MNTANLQNSWLISSALRKPLPYLHRRLLHEGPDTIDELLDRHLVKDDKTKHLDDDESELLTRQRLTSTRRETLSLYRDIIRTTQFFTWPDSRGVLWRDVLRENARKEFDEDRFERDPEVVTRLLIGAEMQCSPRWISSWRKRKAAEMDNERK